MFVHQVLFSFVDSSPAAVRDFLRGCDEHLRDHPGTLFYAAGTRAADIQWSVSDCDFDAALLLVFGNQAAHDAYQDSPRHTQFLEKFESNWRNVRSIDWRSET